MLDHIRVRPLNTYIIYCLRPCKPPLVVLRWRSVNLVLRQLCALPNELLKERLQLDLE